MSSENPLITFFLFTYNQERYIEEACKAAFSQTYSPLEIIISDDCSTDKTFEIVSRLAKEYHGPHSLVLNRNDKNLGLVGHVNKAFTISKGEIIVAAAGDDISFPERTEVLSEAFKKESRPLLVHSNVIGIDKNGTPLEVELQPVNLQDMPITDLCERVGIYRGAAGAWSKELYELFGPITEENAFEDGVFGFRASLLTRIAYIEKCLLFYRVNVGISTFSSGGSIVGQFLMERSRQRMLIGLMAQRKKDLGRLVGKLEICLYEALDRVLEAEIETLRIRYYLYLNPAIMLGCILKLRFLPLKKAIKMELSWLKECISKMLCLK